ncbi:MAG: hypothetical protein HFJ17_04785 [Clostridia bacterium]|nr:hypothetical protein [Clostridia bacterium]
MATVERFVETLKGKGVAMKESTLHALDLWKEDLESKFEPSESNTLDRIETSMNQLEAKELIVEYGYGRGYSNLPLNKKLIFVLAYDYWVMTYDESKSEAFLCRIG